MYAMVYMMLYHMMLYHMKLFAIYALSHENFVGIQRVSNLSTENKHISTPAHVLVVQIGKGLWFEVNGTNQKKDGKRGRNPTTTKLLGRYSMTDGIHGISICHT